MIDSVHPSVVEALKVSIDIARMRSDALRMTVGYLARHETPDIAVIHHRLNEEYQCAVSHRTLDGRTTDIREVVADLKADLAAPPVVR